MFFKLEDIRRRRLPTWTLKQLILLPLGTTSELFIHAGIMIGFVTIYFQQFITNFIRSSALLSKHYEPPTSLTQARTWFNSVLNLQHFNKAMRDGRQIALYGGFFDIGLKIACYRQFNII